MATKVSAHATPATTKKQGEHPPSPFPCWFGAGLIVRSKQTPRNRLTCVRPSIRPLSISFRPICHAPRNVITATVPRQTANNACCFNLVTQCHQQTITEGNPSHRPSFHLRTTHLPTHPTPPLRIVRPQGRWLHALAGASAVAAGDVNLKRSPRQ